MVADILSKKCLNPIVTEYLSEIEIQNLNLLYHKILRSILHTYLLQKF